MKTHEEILKAVLHKIEKELDNCDVSDVIAYSGYSQYHFHRLFVAYMGESVSQYIKRLKLQKAATQIQTQPNKITTIALDAGYATHSAFCVAFHEMFGVSPTEFKTQNKILPKEYKMLKPEIIVIEPVKVLAVRHIGDYKECGVAWEKIMKFAYTQKFKNKKNLMGKNARIFGIGYDNPHVTETSKLRYDACITHDDTVVLEEGIKEMTIDGGKYARFLHKGSYDGLAEMYNQIFGGWVIENNITLRDVPLFEEYLNRDSRRTKPENLKTFIYIPIV